MKCIITFSALDYTLKHDVKGIKKKKKVFYLWGSVPRKWHRDDICSLYQTRGTEGCYLQILKLKLIERMKNPGESKSTGSQQNYSSLT